MGRGDIEATAMRKRHVPGMAVAVVRHDRVLRSEAFGSADLAAPRAMTTDTQFLWFSMSKVATATTAIALAERGDLDLEAPIGSYLPDWPTATGPEPRVANLLDHTAGIANPAPIAWVRPASAPPGDTAELLRKLLPKCYPSKLQVGGPATYSNVGYLALAEVMAAASGRPFVDLVLELVLEPAGMHHTGFDWDPSLPGATGYFHAPRVVGPVLRRILPPGIVGPQHGSDRSFERFLVEGPGYGGLVGTAVEASRLAALHLGDGQIDGRRVISEEGARRMRTLSSLGKPRDFGQAWFRPSDHAQRTPSYAEHLGAGGGYWNAMRIYPDLDLAVVLMTNTTRGLDHDAICTAAVEEFGAP